MGSTKEISLTLDGRTVKVPAEWTLLRTLEHFGIKTPVICFHEATTPEGICRQCVVEVEGRRTLLPACVTQVSEGMVVHSTSARVVRARRTILEMLHASTDLSQAPELQEQTRMYNANPQRFLQTQRRDPAVRDDNPFYVRDYEKCILCWRCVQACGDDLQFTYALSVGGRGHATHIATFFDAPMPETTCVFCGNCVAVCPTGALRGKTEFFLEQGLDYDQIRLEKRKHRRKQASQEHDHD
ncbi:MAG: 4Fe-4S dicluster domain-containing protein [Anaerolineales bacterium]|nr:MAG: 4Fe-4S dicluster domain-containing protein [Anaerolineales bacterium]